MHYNYESPNLMMPTRQTKMLGLGIATIAFLLATIPVFHSGVLYADGDHDNGDHDNGDHDNGDHDNGDHEHNCDNGDHEDHGDCEED